MTYSLDWILWIKTEPFQNGQRLAKLAETVQGMRKQLTIPEHWPRGI